MSLKRFQFLCANLRFDDISSRNTLFQHDRTAAIRDLFESFVRNCEKVMHPDVYLSLDETLYPTRVRVAFLQYSKDKPAQYGLLLWSINSAEVPYTFTSVIYAGKPVGKPGPYYVQTTDDIVKYLVKSLTREANIKGHNLSTDRFYTSIEIANWLLEKNVTCVATIKGNRRGIGDLKSLVNRESPSSTKVYWNKDNTTLNVISYVVNTKSSGKRNVLVLSTLNLILGLTKDDGKSKPAIIKFYDFTKGGTDIVEQIMGKHTVKPKSSKWTVAAFSYIPDVACVNASTLSRINNQNKPTQRSKSFEFG